MQLMQSTNSLNCDAESTRQGRLRIGAVSYLNSKPLIFQMHEQFGEVFDLSLDVPSKLSDELNDGEIDVGLIPVVEYFRNPDFRIVSDAAIACCGPVWSVRILFRCEPRLVKTIAMDEGSRTSVALTQILFHARFGRIPAAVTLPLDADPRSVHADAVLVIGDRAMHPEEFRREFFMDWDLGQEWHELTGLPFVFAAWVARNDSIASQLHAEFLERARDAGTANINTIAAESAANYRLTNSQCVDYLTNYIRFHMGPEESQGLQEFRKRCSAINLVP